MKTIKKTVGENLTALCGLIIMVAAILGCIYLVSEPQRALSQTTNLNTGGASNNPVYPTNTIIGINAYQVITADTIANATNYYTNTTPTNYASGSNLFNLGIMAAPKSLNVYFSFNATFTNGAIGPGTNIGVTVYLDESSGNADWNSYITLNGTLNSNGFSSSYPNTITVGSNVSVGGALQFRVNHIASTNNAGTTTNGWTNLCAQFSCKNNL